MAPPAATTDDAELLAGLRRGEEQAFLRLVDRHHASLLRLALTFVRDRSVAEEVVQETWLGVLRGVDRFAERSSLRTWITRILVNQARSAGVREARSIPFSAVPSPSEGGPAVDPDRFDAGGSWVAPPRPWQGLPEERLLSREVRELVGGIIETLPPSQREVILLRDVDGLSAAETCDVLGLTEGNQRVLLHRARSRVRAALEAYLADG